MTVLSAGCAANWRSDTIELDAEILSASPNEFLVAYSELITPSKMDAIALKRYTAGSTGILSFVLR